MTATPQNLDRVLYTGEQVAARIAEVATEISDKYRGRELKLIGVLKGSVFFLTALARALTIPVKIDFLAISSFGGNPPGKTDPIQEEDVLLVEDIVDTGFTTRYLLQTLAGRGPRSLGICTLLDRSSRRIVQVPVDFRCFEIGDRFVVGCGLDFQQLYRNLDYIAVLNPEALETDKR